MAHPSLPPLVNHLYLMLGKLYLNPTGTLLSWWCNYIQNPQIESSGHFGMVFLNVSSPQTHSPSLSKCFSCLTLSHIRIERNQEKSHSERNCNTSLFQNVICWAQWHTNSSHGPKLSEIYILCTGNAVVYSILLGSLFSCKSQGRMEDESVGYLSSIFHKICMLKGRKLAIGSCFSVSGYIVNMVACLFQLQIHKGSLMKSPEIGIEILSTEPKKYQIMFSISLG